MWGIHADAHTHARTHTHTHTHKTHGGTADIQHARTHALGSKISRLPVGSYVKIGSMKTHMTYTMHRHASRNHMRGSMQACSIIGSTSSSTTLVTRIAPRGTCLQPAARLHCRLQKMFEVEGTQHHAGHFQHIQPNILCDGKGLPALQEQATPYPCKQVAKSYKQAAGKMMPTIASSGQGLCSQRQHREKGEASNAPSRHMLQLHTEQRWLCSKDILHVHDK